MITDDLLNDEFIDRQGLFNTEEIRNLKSRLFSANPGEIEARIWGLIVFQYWWKNIWIPNFLKMPKVLRIINRLNLGGPTYNAAYLSKYLAPEFETMLVAGIKEDDEESSEFIVTDMGLQPVYIPEMRREINFTNDRIAYQKIKNL